MSINDDFLNELEQDISAALDANEQLQRYTNYGKLKVEVERIHWQNKQPVQVDSDTYRNLPANTKQMNLILSVDVQEFKSDLDFGYYRKIKFCGKDWYDILEPSLVKVFGLTGSGRELTSAAAKALFGASGKYVFVDDVPNKGGKTYNDKVLKVPALTSVFNSREELINAVNERFGGLPDDIVTRTNISYPEDTIKSVKMLSDLGWDYTRISKEVNLTESDVKAILGG